MKAFKTVIKDIMWICKPLWRYGKTYIILSVCILGLYSPIDDIIYVRFPEIIINLLSAGKPFALVAAVAVAICGISFLNNAVRKLSRAYFSKKKTQIELKLNHDIYQKAMRLDYKYIDNPKYYDNFTWAMREYAQQVDEGRELIVSLCQCLLSLIAIGAIIISFGPWILLVEVVQMALHTAVNTQVNRNSIRQKEALIPLDRHLDYIHRLFYLKDFAADMKSTPVSKLAFQQYSDAAERKTAVVDSSAKKIELWNCVHEIIFCLTELVIVLYLARSITVGRLPEVGMYMTLMLSFYRLDSKVDTLTYLMKDAAGLSLNVQKIRAFFDLESEIETEKAPNGPAPSGDHFSVAFRDVCFSYENSAFSLSGLDLQIEPGEKIAIVGENGAGKSTFVKLLLRLYDVESGEICINDVPIKEYDVHTLREKIGVAFQHTNIYAMSFADNISLYGEVTEAALQNTIELLELDAILEKNHADCRAELTKEFHENGIILSGGEAQKIALARVMSGSFGLLILDEPSSALDPIAEDKMGQLIMGAANKATTIIVAHRLSMIREADRIVVLDQGKICECGTHSELMDIRGKYYEMFTRQAKNYRKE